MPPACPVDTYALSYCSKERNDPPGKPVAFNSTLISEIRQNFLASFEKQVSGMA